MSIYNSLLVRMIFYLWSNLNNLRETSDEQEEENILNFLIFAFVIIGFSINKNIK